MKIKVCANSCVIANKTIDDYRSLWEILVEIARQLDEDNSSTISLNTTLGSHKFVINTYEQLFDFARDFRILRTEDNEFVTKGVMCKPRRCNGRGKYNTPRLLDPYL